MREFLSRYLAYPFLTHELGHNALFKYDKVFPQSFWPVLEQVTNGLLRQSLADKGAARSRARDTVTLIRQLWSPTANHYNWAHEIAMDVIALWTTGPAYLATFHDILEDEELNPYLVGQSHPPYEIRANALIDLTFRTLLSFDERYFLGGIFETSLPQSQQG